MKVIRFLINNKSLVLIIVIYNFVMLSFLSWGVPNESHPFPYHMDEWHQLQSVRAVFKHGTPNIPGAAHGPMFQFLLSGIFLAPFYITGVVDPFAIKSAVTALEIQKILFEILRLNTLLFGTLSIIVVWKIVKDYIKGNPLIPTIFFVANPLWLTLSNYFKYDIALIFWLLLSLWGMLWYGKRPTVKRYCVTGLFVGLAIATKISALPIILPYVLSFFLFTDIKKRAYTILGFGALTVVGIFLIAGIPDVLLGRGEYYEFFYSNLVSGPNQTSNFILGSPYFFYLPFIHYPLIFGHVLYIFGCISAFFCLWVVIKKSMQYGYKKEKLLIVILASFFIFLVSLIPLKIGAAGNRALVLLPFFVLFISIFLSIIYKKIPLPWRKFFIFLFIVGIGIQLLESFAWVYIKLPSDPRQVASAWLQKHIPQNSIIGLENIPIYQFLPDLIQKEFYFYQYGVLNVNKYKYKVIDSKTEYLPSYVIVTNSEIEMKVLKKSPKKDLIRRLEGEKYTKIAIFSPDIRYYNFFGSSVDYYISGIIPAPLTITVFRK